MAKAGLLPKLRTKFQLFGPSRRKPDAAVVQRGLGKELIPTLEPQFGPRRHAMLIDGDMDQFPPREIDKVLSHQQNRIDELSEKIQLKTSEMEAINRLVSAAADVIDNFQKLLTERDKKIQELETDNSSLSAKVQRQHEMLSEADAELQTLRNAAGDLSSYMSRLSEVSAELENARTADAEKTRELENLQQRLEEQLRNLDEARAQLEMLQSVIAARNTQIDTHKRDLITLQETLETERKAFAQSENKIATLEKQVKALEDMITEKDRLLAVKEIASGVAAVVLDDGAKQPQAPSFPSPQERQSVQSDVVVRAPTMRSEERQRERRAIEESGLFDERWYRSQNPDVATSGLDALDHYLDIGGKEGRDPSPRFSTQRYYELNKDAPGSEHNPLLVYLGYPSLSGKAENSAGRKKI